MYVQISYEVVNDLSKKLSDMSREDWDKLDNKKRIKLNNLHPKLKQFIRICHMVRDFGSTFPIYIDDQELILEILK